MTELVSLTLAEPDLLPLERLVLILAQVSPGNQLIAERSAAWLVSDKAFLAAVKKLVRKGYLVAAVPDDGQIKLQEAR